MLVLDARLSLEAESNPDVAKELISDTHVCAAPDPVWSQRLLGGQHVTLTQIFHALQAFSSSYHNCWNGNAHNEPGCSATGPHTGSVRIYWGTSNGSIPQITDPQHPNTNFALTMSDGHTQAYHFGLAWSEMVWNYQKWLRTPNTLIHKSIYNRQSVSGAFDVEQDPGPNSTNDPGTFSWSDSPITRALAHGYVSFQPPNGEPPETATRRPLVDDGSNDIGACQTPMSSCDFSKTHWTVKDITYIAHDAVGADGNRYESACPQIYKASWPSVWRDTQDFAVGWKGGIYFACILTSSTKGCLHPAAQGGPFLSEAEAWTDWFNAMGPQYTTNRWFGQRLTFLPPNCS